MPSNHTQSNTNDISSKQQTIDTSMMRKKPPIKIELSPEQCAGHGDHWDLLTGNISEDVPNWLQTMLESASIPHGLHSEDSYQLSNRDYLLVDENKDVHVKQILAIKNEKPSQLINAFPAVNSPYGITCQIDSVIACEDNFDAVLRLRTADGTIVYAFDQLYTVNRDLYLQETDYFVNLSAWVYRIKSSDVNEVILVEDQDAVRYHRAFNDIVAQNDGNVPDDIQDQINAWQPETDAPLAPVEINMGNMCAYLFGETLGQEDDAWCQGQVLGKQETSFNGIELILFDVVMLREPDSQPLVVRMCATKDDTTQKIQVQDYVQANLWMQASVYLQNQKV